MRKTICLTIASLCIAFISQAQISKGSTFLGGSLNFSGNSVKDDANPINNSSTHSFGVSPQFGKAINTNAVLGVFLNYYRYTSESTIGTQTAKNSYDAYGGGVFYRRYYPFAKRFYLFGEASTGFSYGNTGYTNNSVLSGKSKPVSVAASLTPGLSFAASKNLHLETSLNQFVSFYYRRYKGYSYNSSGTQTNVNTYTDYVFQPMPIRQTIFPSACVGYCLLPNHKTA